MLRLIFGYSLQIMSQSLLIRSKILTTEHVKWYKVWLIVAIPSNQVKDSHKALLAYNNRRASKVAIPSNQVKDSHHT